MAKNALSSLLKPPEDEPYFAALGKFIASYAMAEHQVHILARRLTNMNDAKARIVFSGMRLGDLSDRIRGILRATNTKKKRFDEIDACLTQLDRISGKRNNLVHRFVNYHDGKITVTNAVISKTIDNSEYETFEIKDFDNMDCDCTAITLRLSDATRRKKKSPQIRDWMHQPWRYKPVPPKTQKKQRP
jgi:hypothetical protein